MAHAYLNQTGPTGVAIMDGQAGTLCGCLAVTACHMALSAFARSFSIQAEPIVSLRQLVVVFSGKRKSGKDFVTDILLERLGPLAEIVRVSAPLKAQYAKEHNLDLNLLLGASEYKERYRLDMIRWGEQMRAGDPGYFCRLACEGCRAPVLILSDARRPSDMAYFNGMYKTITVRVMAPQADRRARGWQFTAGVDDAASECALDNCSWDVTVENGSANSDEDGSGVSLQDQLDALERRIRSEMEMLCR